jgi:hypothetical protein
MNHNQISIEKSIYADECPYPSTYRHIRPTLAATGAWLEMNASAFLSSFLSHRARWLLLHLDLDVGSCHANAVSH